MVAVLMVLWPIEAVSEWLKLPRYMVSDSGSLDNYPYFSGNDGRQAESDLGQ